MRDYVPKNTATGTKTDTPLKEVPQSISVVGAEQIRDQGAQTAQDALRYTAGVTADAYGLDSRVDGSFIRGTTAAEYLDGMRRTLGSYTNNYRIDPFFLERIEVLRGPASVLYGQASVGGIINSVSKRPQTEEGGEISVEYGTFDFKQVKFDMTGPITSDKKWSYRLTGMARDADTQVDYVEDDRYAIQPAITYRPDGNTTITVLGHFQKDHTGSTQQFWPHVGTIFPNASGNYIAQNRFVGEPDDKYDTNVASGTLLVEHKFNEVFKLQHSSRYADIHITSITPPIRASLPIAQVFLFPTTSIPQKLKCTGSKRSRARTLRFSIKTQTYRRNSKREYWNTAYWAASTTPTTTRILASARHSTQRPSMSTTQPMAAGNFSLATRATLTLSLASPKSPYVTNLSSKSHKPAFTCRTNFASVTGLPC